jgi:hypothetical protein
MIKITAWDKTEAKRIVCFTWAKNAESGIAKAKEEARNSAFLWHLTDFQAEVAK